MHEPNYVVIAINFLAPALYFVVTGLLVPSRQINWHAVSLGLVPGIGLTASVLDACKLMRSIYSARREADSRRRLAERPALADNKASTIQQAAVNEEHSDTIRRAA